VTVSQKNASDNRISLIASCVVFIVLLFMLCVCVCATQYVTHIINDSFLENLPSCFIGHESYFTHSYVAKQPHFSVLLDWLSALARVC